MEDNQFSVKIPFDGFSLEGDLCIPDTPKALILFSHGSGSSRFSVRNRAVATALNQAQFATLLVDLLTEKEDEVYETRFDIPLLTERLVHITKWIKQDKRLKNLPIGLFGASTGAASALRAAAALPREIYAVVSRGGRPDLASNALPQVKAPTLLIVGELDEAVIALNALALNALACTKQLEIVAGATHLFPEPGCMEQVIKLAQSWFEEQTQ